MAYSDIIFEKREAIATITINRPQVMNACTLRTYGEITEALQDAERDDGIRAVVLTGAGRGLLRRRRRPRDLPQSRVSAARAVAPRAGRGVAPARPGRARLPDHVSEADHRLGQRAGGRLRMRHRAHVRPAHLLRQGPFRRALRAPRPHPRS